ncbi:MAG: hypothetical protein GY903_05500 [Fuerstiella sp.]|nr:hypothetical protein [Fuerstiella sp.]MCP4853929.1 hypothetical protein [Fuerstiella sp.]
MSARSKRLLQDVFVRHGAASFEEVANHAAETDHHSGAGANADVARVQHAGILRTVSATL